MGYKAEEPPHQSPRNDSIDDDYNLLVEDVELIEDDDDDMVELELDEEENAVDTDDFDEVFVPEVDNSVVTFDRHTGPVYACTFHPNGAIIASGSEIEMLYVWDSCNQTTLLEEKFEDSVELIRFSHDGKYLAAVDMLGNFICWKFTNNNFIKIHSSNYEDPSWMEWHPQANVLILAEKSQFCMWKVPNFDIAKYFALDCSSQIGCFMPDGKNALIGFDDGYAVILDLSSFTVTAKLKQPDMNLNHSIVSLDVHPDNNVVALGTMKGRVLLFTSRNSKMVNMLEIPETDYGNHIETVKFGHESLIGLLIVSFSEYIHVYDSSKLVLRHSIQLSGVGTRLVCIEPYVYVGTVKAVVDIFDCRTGEKKSSLQGHTKAIMDITVSKDTKRLMTSSDDTYVKIYNLENHP